MTMMRIAVTGGIAAGKSTVVNYLRSFGAFVIDYDVLARKVVEPGSAVLQKIVSIFGENAVKNDGSLNREFIAEHIFGDDVNHKQALSRIESLIHPAIYDLAKTLEGEYISEYSRKISKEDCSERASLRSVIVHDIPLLAQVIDSIPFSFDHIITVEAPKDVRIARMISERKMSQNQAEQRISNQVEEIERKKIADFVVDSTKPMEVMLKSVDSKIKTWMGKEH
ncbi:MULTISPECIES: dephospho-CoA kinase [Gardnerella]|jgi:dephospho-coA kinase|uniref:Dephospho-CoA kinase n=1 Tax=Gardnerella vaginalis TaxID=2702 RepID=A0AAW6XVC2_GARVA|nr:dephospho-CoA kinase [Gardnerella vaginalis]EPI51368.1 dephospho-CoA kinase [Gardnerella vaginalis JCP7672]MDK6861112.1 dephospho-CoA kinase [Gardnerella vaginalis]MDK7062997.1 dephospho-CoA kinase [Gardnerella vaginalis]NSX27952.1 dephospho-CoA kinase [Gardnerella vaginalis]NSX28777.1 dephospho-CoA kinase [Gardnerella vaginalis]